MLFKYNELARGKLLSIGTTNTYITDITERKNAPFDSNRINYLMQHKKGNNFL